MNRGHLKQNLKQVRAKFGQALPKQPLKYLQDKIIYEPRIKKLGIDSKTTPVFDTVFFQVRTKCNGSCSFCAASVQNDIRQDTTMPMELYIKVIDELKDIQFSGRIAYHVNNDPLIFPKLTDFAEYARRKLPTVWIQILTNGRALSIKKAEKLIRSGINELTINYYNDNFNDKLPKPIIDIRDDLLPRFYKKQQIKAGFGPDGENRDIFRFNVFRRRASDILTSRAGTSPNKKDKSRFPRGFCEYPFTQFNITTDGSVSKCCADFYFSDAMGNIKNEKVMNIWRGEMFNNVRRFLLEGNRDAIETCKRCDYYGVKRFYSIIAKFLHLISG